MRILNILTIFFCSILVFQSGYSQNISQWRGVNRDGIYQETNLLKTWPQAGPKLLWATEEIGSGFGSPIIAGGKLFINGEIGGVSHVFAFGLDGKLLWKSPNGEEFMGKDYSANFPGARSTPTIYNNLVYACSGSGRIACLESDSGKELWTVDMVKDLGGKLNYFGYSESLLIDDNLVYCYPGGDETNFVALDKFTGKLVWKSKAMRDPVAFCSPLMIRLPERNVLATVSHNYMMGLDARNGELLWSFHEDSVKLEGDYCNTPIYSDGFLYNVSGNEKGTGAFKLQLSPDGKSIKEIWRNSRVKNAMGGIVKIGDHIFCTSDDKKLKCIDLKSGMVVDSLSNMRGTLISADDHLYCYTDNGRVNLIKHAGAKMEVVGQFKVEKGTKEHFSHPVIANGVLYIRHGNALMAYEIK